MKAKAILCCAGYSSTGVEKTKQRLEWTRDEDRGLILFLSCTRTSFSSWFVGHEPLCIGDKHRSGTHGTQDLRRQGAEDTVDPCIDLFGVFRLVNVRIPAHMAN